MGIEETPKQESNESNPIADEILQMAEVDQEMRRKAFEGEGKWDPEVDEQNTARLKQIIAEKGWPTASKVGEEASRKAWLLAQHADHDRAFQEECLQMMKDAGEDVNISDVAYLEDRVRVGTGRDQLYGTQWTTNEQGEFAPAPIENIGELDKRREEAGLEPFSEYEKQMREIDREAKAEDDTIK